MSPIVPEAIRLGNGAISTGSNCDNSDNSRKLLLFGCIVTKVILLGDDSESEGRV